MIIEDDPFIALDLQDVVEEAGYDVVGPYASPLDALAVLDGDDRPDCALLDFNVRGGTTADMARHLDRIGVPYVFVTANADAVRDALPRLAPLVRTKPVQPWRIVGDVEAMLA